MKPILIHIHIYYSSMWWYVRRHLQCLLSYPHQVFITMVEELPDVREDLTTLNVNAQFITVENRGYDIAPFLQVIQRINLADYSYVIKLHTKRDILGKRFWIQGYEVTGAAWRDYMYDFLKYGNIQRCLDAFERDSHLGMAGNFRLVLDYEPAEDKCWMESLELMRKRLRIMPKTYSFIAGSMFICRAYLMKPLQQLGITTSDFEEHKAHNISNLAHFMERVLGLVVCAQGYSIRDCYTPLCTKVVAGCSRTAFWRNWLRPRREFRNKLKRHY